MKLWASLRVAVKSLGANKLRSLLTMLGVIIGVAAVIIVVAIGEGLKADTLNRILALGTNMLTIQAGHSHTPGARQGHITLADLDALKGKAESVSWTAPELTSNEQAKYRNLSHTTRVVATTPEWQLIRNYKVVEGRFITNADLYARDTVCVLGKTLVDELFYGRPQLGAKIKIRRTSFTVVGILEEKGGGWMNPDDQIIVPFTTGRARLSGGQYLNNILMSAQSSEATTEAVSSIERILRRQHRILKGDDDDFRIRTQEEFLTTMAETGAIMTRFLTGIALVSLLVGGVGIMNIMLVSVTERTREIGIRKAIGAKPRDIMVQFLIESVVLSITGGVLGTGIGLLVIRLIGTALGFTAITSVPAIFTAFGFAAAVGVFFGLYPARKASGLHPIEALRYE